MRALHALNVCVRVYLCAWVCVCVLVCVRVCVVGGPSGKKII